MLQMKILVNERICWLKKQYFEQEMKIWETNIALWSSLPRHQCFVKFFKGPQFFTELYIISFYIPVTPFYSFLTFLIFLLYNNTLILFIKFVKKKKRIVKTNLNILIPIVLNISFLKYFFEQYF